MAWSLGALVFLVLLLPAALYIPWVQNVAKNYACDYVKKETGLDVSIDRVLIKFPLDVSLDNVCVLYENRDTMLTASNFTASIAMRPLLNLQVNVDEARLSDAYYHQVSEDSSMVFSARVNHCRLKGSQVDLERNLVNVLDGELTGGKVDLDYRPWKKVYEEPDTATTAWRINAYHLKLKDIDYTMTMLPTIDRMTVHLAEATLEDGKVDTGEHLVNAKMLAVDSVDCRYTYYPSARAAEFERCHPLPVDTFRHPSSDSIPWLVKADSLSLKRSHAVYAASGAQPRGKSLDMDYIEADGINVGMKNFYNRGTDVSMVVSELAARERCGVEVTSGHGGVSLTGDALALTDFRLKTRESDISLDTRVDMSMLDNPSQGNLRLTTDSRISLPEVTRLYPDLAPTLKGIPQSRPLAVRGNVSGNLSHLRLDRVNVDLPQVLTAQATGTVDNVTDPKRLSGNLDFTAKTGNLNSLKGQFLDKATAAQINLPPMAMSGRVNFSPTSIKGDAKLSTGGGTAVAKGEFNTSRQSYDIDATMTNFPVSSLMPSLGVGDVTAHVTARGQGFDFLKGTTTVDAQVDLNSLAYNGAVYSNIRGNVKMQGGHVSGHVVSGNKNCDLDVAVDGTIQGDRYVLDLNGKVNSLDLKALKMYDGECNGSALVDATVDIDLKRGIYNGSGTLRDVKWHLDGDDIYSDEMALTFAADKNSSMASFEDEGSHFHFNADCGLDDLLKHFTKVADIAKRQYHDHSLDMEELHHALPKFDLSVKMTPNGLVQRYLARYDVDFRDIDLTMRNDSTIFMDGKVMSLSIGETVIDTLILSARERNKYLTFDAHMGNHPGTWDEFAQVDIHGGAIRSTVDFLVEQRNIKGEQGYRIGANATLRKSEVAVRLFPHEPIIGYRQWEMNDSNYVNIDYVNRRLLADLQLKSDESKISLTSLPASYDANKDDIDLKIENLKIEEWTRIVPSLEDMTGTLNADIQLDFDGKNVEGDGVAEIKSFTYAGRKEGDLAMKTHFQVDPLTASTRVNADIDIDGSTVAVAMGSLNDETSESPFNLDMTLKRFPLKKANPFIPGNLIRLDGFLTGDVAIKGSMENPIINGYLEGDSAMVKVPRYGSTLRISNERIPVKGNVINFNDFKILGLNDQPVNLNGVVDVRNLDNMVVDLQMQGRNVQFIGAEQRRMSEIFGKGYADFSGAVRMRGDYIDVRADATLLTGSNITYVMQEEVSTLTSRVDKNMVTFINPNDSVSANQSLMTAARSSSVNVLVNIGVEQGAKINVFLSEDGNDRASIDGSGNLRYTLDFAGKDNLSGTYTITSGSVRYTPPVISQKQFTIEEGSRITWTGDMLNPQLDLSAYQQQKASVSGDDKKSRFVDFLIEANVGGTLGNMDLNFDLEATNDMTVANEIQSMSPSQRSQAAINMLLYNTYSGLSSASGPNISAQGTLFSFLQTKLNNWASNTLKGFDISFGINQYDATVNGKTGTQTSYSYRLSKTLFNDRFKIVVGGEYATDVSKEENFSNNLFNDISFEYYLTPTGSRYVRLFRHTGYESVIEGQVTKMGAGFVMKHKASTLKSLFYPWRDKKKEAEPAPEPSTPVDESTK